MKNLITAFKAFQVIRKNGAILTMMTELINFVTRVSDECKPMLCKIALVNTKDGTKLCDFVSLWAGIGEANPIERIRALKAQNDEYQRQLKLISEKYPLSTEDKEMIETTIKYFNL
jgi:hypothetical protein